MTNQNNNEKEITQQLAKERLDRIDILFAAVGPFVSALFVAYGERINLSLSSICSRRFIFLSFLLCLQHYYT